MDYGVSVACLFAFLCERHPFLDGHNSCLDVGRASIIWTRVVKVYGKLVIKSTTL